MPLGRITPNRRTLLGSAAALLAAPVLLKGATAEAKAPLLGPQATTFYRFRLGEFEITNILDASVMIDGPWPIVGEDRPAAEVEQLMQANLLPPKRFRPGFTPTLVNTGSQLILFDTGNGEAGFVPPPVGGWLAKALGPAGFTPEQVDVVVLTHAHPDHMGGLLTGGKPAFPNARYVIGEKEYAYWKSGTSDSAPKDSNTYKSGQMFRTYVQPLSESMSFLKSEGEVATGIRAVEAHGHTPGHLAFHIESNGKRLLLWGDCAHHEVASLAKPEWHALFDMDKEQGAATRKRIYDMAATERIAVAAYHTSFPSVGFVERDGTAYRWLPVTYQLEL